MAISSRENEDREASNRVKSVKSSHGGDFGLQ